MTDIAYQFMNTKPQMFNLTWSEMCNTDGFLYLRIFDPIGIGNAFRSFISVICGAGIAFKL